MSRADEICTDLLASGIAKPDEIGGCSDDEVRRLERCLNVVLPEAYVQFLKALGHKAGSLMADVDYHYCLLERINTDARKILDNWEEGRLPLPEKAFVFSMRQGEQFMFFVADGSLDDPPIYYYFEGRGEFKRAANSIWEVIEAELEIQERLRREYPDSPFWS